MPSRRPRLSLLFVGGAVLLLVAIAIGERLGDRVLMQATERQVPVAGPRPTPVVVVTDPAREASWRRERVISVATDPAFPDPRVTPVPTPRPTPVPTARPTPTPIPPPLPPASSYTSPPLPIPIVSHDPGENNAASPTPGIVEPSATRPPNLP